MTDYTATTSNASNTITALASDSDNTTIVIKNGSTTVTNGGSAQWSEGENTLTVTVKADGNPDTVYTVIVTREEQEVDT